MTTPNNLPAELTSFVGREPQLAELRRLMHRSRLITLTGPGGAGKTRLALRLASTLLERFPDGVWVVELASVIDSLLLEQSIATACGIREEKERAAAQVLIEGLAGRRTLLVLDSAEHLVDACAALASQVLRSCHGVTLLVTSREPLGVSGELIWRTPSLTLPRPADSGRPELLLQSEAVRLFVERTQLNRPAFELDASSCAGVEQICSRLEGIPLALELAAGLTGAMTLVDIVDGLSDRFRLLTGGSRSALPRHQTLRQAVDWSYRLLSEEEQTLFVTLAAFSGGFDLAAAEAVAGSESAAVDTRSLLQRLVTKSLVMTDPSGRGHTRYQMLETIREYALEELHDRGDRDVRQRHADYFVEWAETTANGLRTGDLHASLDRMADELANIRLALDWTIAQSPEKALRLAAAFGQYASIHGLYLEGVGWLDRALDNRTSPTLARAIAFRTRSRLHRKRGDFKSAQRDATEAVRIARDLGDDRQVAAALTILGIVASSNSHFLKAERLHRQALDLARKTGQQSLVAMGLNNLALLSVARDRPRDAIALITEAIANIEPSGDRLTRAMMVESLGRIQYSLGDFEASEKSFLEALAAAAEFSDPETTAEVCDGLGLLAVSRRNPRRAIKLFAAAIGLHSRYGFEVAREFRQRIQESLTVARSQVGKQLSDQLWREGEALTLAEAVELASGAATPEKKNGELPLTNREIQVARGISNGLTNGEIAGQLRISSRTVDAHVEHIRNKLGLRTRTQIAVWAKERLGTA